jgi:hypothetical protein
MPAFLFLDHVQLLALVLLNVVEQAVHSAWETALARKPRPPKAVVTSRVSLGGVKHV